MRNILTILLLVFLGMVFSFSANAQYKNSSNTGVSALSQTAKGIDILAADPQTLRPLAIQVKTSRKGRREWMLRAAHENIHAPGLFYVLVDMPLGKVRPEFYVVRSKIVADRIRKSHRLWKKTSDKKGRKHGFSDIRVFRDPDGEWLNRWDVLKADHQ